MPGESWVKADCSRNEFLAVRNSEGGFYLCQAVQNIYKTSSKIKIRWLSQTKSDDKGEEYTPDFYDLIGKYCQEKIEEAALSVFLCRFRLHIDQPQPGQGG